MSSSDLPIDQLHHLLENAKVIVADLVLSVIPSAFPEAGDCTDIKAEIISKQCKPQIKGAGDLALPCFVFAKKIKGPPMKTAELLADALNKHLENNKSEAVAAAKAAGPYLNIHLTTAFFASVITHILSGVYLVFLFVVKFKCMVEYSQPNTHKAFHVGHMRNAALGDSLVRLYEQVGHPVIAANYFGDEGAHVAKCLWFLKRFLAANPDFVLDSVPVEERGEWLGGMYSKSVEALDLSTLTRFPYPNVLAAKVLSVGDHPAADAPKNWHVVKLQIDANGKEATVVCGGKGYKEGDLVAYYPLGTVLKNKTVVEPKDMKGIMSEGIMLAEKELGIEEEEEKKEEKKDDKKKEEKKEKGGKKEEKKDGDKKEEKKEDKKDKKKEKEDNTTPNNKIFVLPADVPVGVEVAEFGRFPNLTDVPADKKVVDEIKDRKKQVGALLSAMEHGEAEICALWAKTKEWSLLEFKRIYAWLNCRFDHDFFESEVSEESRKMVLEYVDKVFTYSNGALGADLSKHGLGFCMVLKSDGSGLYATKDLSLAKRKFDNFGVEKSLYIVDAAQTLHFKQVFKTLELMGYERAKNCTHLPYGQVVLPSGKMSSRTGTVIYFSQLKNQLDKDIYEKFLAKYEPGKAPAAEENKDEAGYVKAQPKGKEWSVEEIKEAQHRISVATIKYGMLNHDTAKDIVFVLDDWTAKSGNTGPYMLYAYARIQSILSQITLPDGVQPDYSLLTLETERHILALLHEFWDIVERCVANNNPSTLCGYVFDLSKAFSSWYDSVDKLVTEPNATLKVTRVNFMTAIGHTVKRSLNLLGIDTLDRM